MDLLDREVGNPEWVTTRGFFLSALREAFLKTGLDCSSFIDGIGMTLTHVRLAGDKVVRLSPEPAPTSEAADDVMPDVGPLSLADALVRSMSEGDSERTRALATALLKEHADSESPVEPVAEGIVRPFADFEDIDRVARLSVLDVGRVLSLSKR